MNLNFVNYMNPTIKFILWAIGTTILICPGLYVSILIGCNIKRIRVWKKWININYESRKFWVLYFVFILMFMFGLQLAKNGLE